MNYVLLYFVDVPRTMLVHVDSIVNKITSKFQQQNDVTQIKGANLHYDYCRLTEYIEIKFVVSTVTLKLIFISFSGVKAHFNPPSKKSF